MDSDDSRRVFGSANFKENFDVFLWLLDGDGTGTMFIEKLASRARESRTALLQDREYSPLQNFENTSICGSHSSFSATRDEDRSFMKV
jgi:hypothetical protein